MLLHTFRSCCQCTWDAGVLSSWIAPAAAHLYREQQKFAAAATHPACSGTRHGASQLLNAACHGVLLGCFQTVPDAVTISLTQPQPVLQHWLACSDKPAAAHVGGKTNEVVRPSH